ncbi:MAG: hypothetical protein F6K26_19845 [Moorea sp. SIO2I5]|nr:hypothetical protein [Moorena sp. SIO2I5]
MKLKRLKEWSERVYNQIGAAKDAVFELMDATLLSAIAQVRKLRFRSVAWP